MASNFLDLLSHLHDQHVEFVIVGGVAAALHGGSRVTFDVDVVPRLDQPSWQREKGMLALNFRSPDGSVDIDFLVSESERFDDIRARAVAVRVGHRTFLVASIDDLIAMKERAGRPQGRLDIAQLQSIQKRLRDP